MTKRIRNAMLSVWYTLVKNRFSIRNGSLYVPHELIELGDERNGIRRIPIDLVSREGAREERAA